MSDKKAQVLVLDPPVDLVFKGPFTEVVTSQLTLQNPSNEQVIFKVKTTAPKQYCVRPNSGLLKPQEMATISVMLQPFEHSSADKSKHKFMVQTMFAPSGFKVESLDAVWKDANKSQLMDSKLRCVFLDEGDDAGGVAGNVTQNQPAVTESTTNSSSFSSGIKVDVPTTPKQEEEQPPPAPVPSSNAGSGNTAGSNFQSNAGSTPAHVAPAAKEMEKATVESKVRMLQDKIDQLSSENAQLKPQAADFSAEMISKKKVQGTPAKIIQKTRTASRPDDEAEDKMEKRASEQLLARSSSLRHRGRAGDTSSTFISGGRQALASHGKAKPILMMVLLIVLLLFAAMFFLR